MRSSFGLVLSLCLSEKGMGIGLREGRGCREADKKEKHDRSMKKGEEEECECDTLLASLALLSPRIGSLSE